MSEPADFQEMVDAHYANLFRFALSLSGNENDASDLTQQAFWIWARKGRNLRDASKAKSWLFTTLYREFLQRRRRETRFQHEELSDVEKELPEAPADVSASLDSERLLQCLKRLDPTFQAPIALFYLEDYSYQEIAEILDAPLGTIKSRISRGIVQLQRRFLEQPTPKPVCHNGPINS